MDRGRERYARAAASPGAREGSRNGYCDTTIKTTTARLTNERISPSGRLHRP
jgi:putative transposase